MFVEQWNFHNLSSAIKQLGVLEYSTHHLNEYAIYSENPGMYKIDEASGQSSCEGIVTVNNVVIPDCTVDVSDNIMEQLHQAVPDPLQKDSFFRILYFLKLKQMFQQYKVYFLPATKFCCIF